MSHDRILSRSARVHISVADDDDDDDEDDDVEAPAPVNSNRFFNHEHHDGIIVSSQTA